MLQIQMLSNFQIQLLFCLDLNNLINCNKFVVLVCLRVILLNSLNLILFNI